MLLPLIGGTQEAHMTGLINHAEIFDCVALLLATLVFLLVLGIFGALDWLLRTIMLKRGVVDCNVPHLSSGYERSALRFQHKPRP
jgi:hypothetical protein